MRVSNTDSNSGDHGSISEPPDVRRLTYFLAVAETLHFRKAAERLRVAQPALSQQIRRLEQDLGCELFRRNRRGVELTPAGEALFGTGRRAVAEMLRASDAARRAAVSQDRVLRIGFLSPAAFEIVPGILRRLRTARPDVHVVLREAGTAALLEEVRVGLIDLAFVRGPVTAPGVRIDTLRREPLVVVLPSSHRLARRKSVPLVELEKEAFIGFAREFTPSLHDAITGVCLEAGFTPAVVTEASEWYTMVSFVAAGIGIAILPASVRTFTRNGVVYRAIAGARRDVELVVGRRYGAPPDVVRMCLQIATEMTGVTLV